MSEIPLCAIVGLFGFMMIYWGEWDDARIEMLDTRYGIVIE